MTSNTLQNNIRKLSFPSFSTIPTAAQMTTIPDIVRVHGRTADSTPPNPKSTQELQAFNVRRGIELISEGQMSRGSKALLSKGISDIANNEAINNQMKAKFPRRKMAITSPTEAQ